MPVTTFLRQVETLLRRGNATEHSYRPALEQLFATLLAPATATNEPQRDTYGAPDFVIERGAVPIGHVEAKDVGVDLAQVISDSEQTTPRSANGKQLRRYRAALPNLLYTDGLVWHWFVDGQPRLPQPLVIGTWQPATAQVRAMPSAAADLTTLLHQFAAHTAGTVSTPRDLAQRLAQMARIAQPDQPFSRAVASGLIPRTNPFLRKLFNEISGDELDQNIAWLVDDCAHLLNHTNMAAVMADFGRATPTMDGRTAWNYSATLNAMGALRHSVPSVV